MHWSRQKHFQKQKCLEYIEHSSQEDLNVIHLKTSRKIEKMEQMEEIGKKWKNEKKEMKKNGGKWKNTITTVKICKLICFLFQ